MEVSKLTVSDATEVYKKLSRKDKGKLRLRKIQEVYGDQFITLEDIMKVAGFNPGEKKKAYSWVQYNVNAGYLEVGVTDEVNDFGKPIPSYRLKCLKHEDKHILHTYKQQSLFDIPSKLKLLHQKSSSIPGTWSSDRALGFLQGFIEALCMEESCTKEQN